MLTFLNSLHGVVKFLFFMVIIIISDFFLIKQFFKKTLEKMSLHHCVKIKLTIKDECS